MGSTASPDLNYFVCTLGQAAAFNATKPHSFKTINEFFDERRECKDPAVGFPKITTTRQGEAGEARWGYDVLLRTEKITPDFVPFAHANSRDTEADGQTKFADHNVNPLPSAISARANQSKGETDERHMEPIWKATEQDVAYLHHTSGTSTGLPKPIPQTHRAGIGVLPYLDGRDSTSFTTTPLYHGGVADCFRAWTSGAMIWLFPGKDVPITAGNVLKSLQCAEKACRGGHSPKVKYFSSVPYILRMLAEESNGLEILKGMEVVGVGGAALPEAIGNDLVAKGVNLISRFGSAECGFLLSSHRPYDTDKDWQYLRISPESGNSIRFERQAEDDLAELVVLKTWPHMAKKNRDDGSFATADLFKAHSTIPNAWLYHSRADSQLTLVTGKKFDPAPLEAAISLSPLISDAFVFGNGQQFPGALIFRSEASHGLNDVDLSEKIWPHISNLNSSSQEHTRIAREMLVPMPKDAPVLEKSSKGTVLRGQTEKRFSKEIESAYSTQLLAHGDIGSEAPPVPLVEINLFVSQTIQEISNRDKPLAPDMDFFAAGIDSVACMRIRTVLQRRVLPSELASKLPLNVVYDCGTVSRLAEYLTNLRLGKEASQEHEIDLMRTLVDQYGSFTISHDEVEKDGLGRDSVTNGKSHDQEEAIILTGATGSLGAHILDQLCHSITIFGRRQVIYCLVRGREGATPLDRVNESLRKRGRKPMEPSNQGVKCLATQLSSPTLGLSQSDYGDLRRSTKLIIHAAWAVNFSLPLRSFVAEHITGLRNLLDLAGAPSQSHTPRVIFCSSVASVLGSSPSNDTNKAIPEAISHDPATASPLGYSRSKWVAEQICDRANNSKQSGLQNRVAIVRIGQLCGDTQNGIWNETEAWPLMLSTVDAIGALPDLDKEGERLDWLPVDIAARAVIEIAGSFQRREEVDETNAVKNNVTLVTHVLNPDRSVKWSTMLEWMKEIRGVKKGFDLISADDWVQKLEALKGDHPAKRLLGLWKSVFCTGEGDKMGDGGKLSADDKSAVSKRFAMEVTMENVSVLTEVCGVRQDLFGKMWTWIESVLVAKGA
ncbi:hypothetical protein MMC25_000597 [Agyrium rufum]|nr:hypothetical protein [Agyrium rufum]